MNYRLPFLPVADLRELQTPFPTDKAPRILPVDWEDEVELFRAWAAYETGFEPMRPKRNPFLGLLLAFAVGAGFWAAAGLLIARLW